MERAKMVRAGFMNPQRIILMVIVIVMVVIGYLQMHYFAPGGGSINKSEVERLREHIDSLERRNEELQEMHETLKKEVQGTQTNHLQVNNGDDKQTAETLQKENLNLEARLIDLEKALQDRTRELQVAQDAAKNGNVQGPMDREEKNPHKYPFLDPNVNTTVATRYDSLMLLAHSFNRYGAVRNKDKFQLAPDFMPIVIRVYNKHEYFRYVLENYKKSTNINQTMIVVSHDGLFPEMFKLVESIDFCQVKQLIHPYSGHILTNRFPGPDAIMPEGNDQYNNHRPWPHVALKHHFWWHMNYVWDDMFKGHNGDMIFMEEDHVPTWDFYLTAKALAKIRDKDCGDKCWNAKLHQHGHSGGHDVHSAYINYDTGNVGLIIDRPRWEMLRRAGHEFCVFDDYNWDWTIGHLEARGLLPHLYG
eukprot:TRINITY_DN5465_c0_g1_i3.p1 TRINITY_DN5465_c0_g1~~TRINITY_DN5465_c0_g1_i3.p1  ORF type:complete len:418 (+),score=82.46 TRINITY_DN5465_c0_g1_i3:45-1298(+)